MSLSPCEVDEFPGCGVADPAARRRVRGLKQHVDTPAGV